MRKVWSYMYRMKCCFRHEKKCSPNFHILTYHCRSLFLPLTLHFSYTFPSSFPTSSLVFPSYCSILPTFSPMILPFFLILLLSLLSFFFPNSPSSFLIILLLSYLSFFFPNYPSSFLIILLLS